jgi:polyisoprenoid-binding protein YceI
MKPTLAVIIAFATGLLACATFAADSASPANPDPKAAQAGAFQVEPIHTRVQFGVSHLGFSTFYGDFTGVTGSLDLKPASLAGSRVDIGIPTASISTTNTKLDGELKSEQWLDAQKFPTIHFVSTDVKQMGPREVAITGNLTLHGVTKPVTLHATFNGAGVNPLDKSYTAGFDATASLKRSDFNVKTYLPMIGDDLTIRISAAFTKKSS